MYRITTIEEVKEIFQSRQLFAFLGIALFVLAFQLAPKTSPFLFGRLKAYIAPVKTAYLFEKTFTRADCDQYGRVKCFVWTDKYKVGDTIEVIGHAKIWRGKDFNPKWLLVDGHYRAEIKHVPAGKYFGIYVEDVATVRILEKLL